MKILAIILGRSNLRHRLQDILVSSDPTIEIHTTSGKGDAFKAAEQSSDFDVVLSCGGDGTINEVINGLMEIPDDKRPAMGVIALGSGNDFARNLDVCTVSELIDHIRSPKQGRVVDILRINTETASKYALNMITCGIGAEIAATVNRRKQVLPTGINYYSSIVQWLVKYSAPEVKITTGKEEFTSKTLLTALANGTYAGNGLGLNPQSSIDDGLMGVTVIGNVSVIDFLKYQSTLKRADYVEDQRLQYLTSEKTRIEVIDGMLAVETDGEEFVRLEPGQWAEVELLPKAFKLV